jgi:2-oxo-hept-3-ene-1,7-dioate hydratase
MALSEAERKKCVETLLNADREKKQAVQLSTTYPHITIEDAYAISTAVAQHKIRNGAKLIGHKVGLTSKAMQASSQINEPDYGHLLDTMMIPDGGKVPHANYCLPRVEVELAFVLGKPLKGPGVNLLDVLRATEYVVPAIEIVDARVQNPRKIFDTVADNGAAAGPWKPICAGLAASCTATPRSRRPASPRACSAIRPSAWHGSPTGWDRAG